MKNPRIILFAFAILFVTYAMAQNKVNIVINDNATMTPAQRNNAQTQLNLLFSRLNDAQSKNKRVNTDGIKMTANAKAALADRWKSNHFRLKSNSLSLSVCKFHGKFQFINIPMLRFPTSEIEGDKLDGGETEVTVDFDINGNICDFYQSFKRQQYLKLIEGVTNVEEQEKIDNILYWVHELEKNYNKRNINFFEQVLDENAIIITGRKVGKITTTKGEAPKMTADRFAYYRQTKDEYIQNLKRIFNSKKDINIEFTNIDLQCDSTGRYYGVNLYQKWNCTGYSDEGNLFLIWDFKNPDQQQVLVRAWSPKDDPSKKPLTISDFMLSTHHPNSQEKK